MTQPPRQTAPKRILFPFVGGDVVGGSHRSALKLIEGLDRDRFTPVIALHGGDGALGQMIRARGLDYTRIDRPGIIAPRYSRGAGDVSLARYLTQSVTGFRRLLQGWQIDAVHSNDGRIHASWALPTRLAGRAMIWHHRQAPDAFGVRFIAPLLASRIISVSHFSRPPRPIRPIHDRFTVIRSPFDLPETRPDRAACARDLRARIGAGPDALVLGYVGVLNLRKRPAHFTAAIAALRAALPEREIHGVICGLPERPDDPAADELREVISGFGLADVVHSLGQVSPIEPVMAGLDALLVTALDEPFGRTLIEAMHLRIPVIATDHGGNPEAIRNGVSGFLVDPGDPAAFVPPIRQLLNDPTLDPSLTEAAAADLAQYSTAEHIRRVQDVYTEIFAR